MLSSGDSPADTLLGADRPVLLKGRRAHDGGLVGAGAGEDLIRALVDGKVALGSPRLVGREVAVGLDDVVLDEGVRGPAVDGEVARARWRVGAVVLDRSAVGR